MALYGVPIPHEDDPKRAVLTALEMREALARLNDKWKEEKGHTFQIGIGINTGEAIAGNVGSDERMEYTVIGDSVNTASRVEQLTKQYLVDIIITEETYRKVEDIVEVRHIDRVTVVGKTEPIEIYELLSLKS